MDTQKWKDTFMQLIQLPIIGLIGGLIRYINYRNKSGRLHRLPEIGPSLIIYGRVDSNIQRYGYYLDGYCLRNPTPWIEPACVEMYENGIVSSQQYSFMYNGITVGYELHYYESGHVGRIDYKTNFKLHKTDGPARIGWYENGTLGKEAYYINGKLFRENGSAETWYYENGNVKREIFTPLKGNKIVIEYTEDGDIMG